MGSSLINEDHYCSRISKIKEETEANSYEKPKSNEFNSTEHVDETGAFYSEIYNYETILKKEIEVIS